ncbi:MAG: hypothetical protein NTX63_02280 [Candidatus Peregrinibacteria bacterium]|nr:hypothetical protein [Candidatus Peregrinibacteria bacterium]
MKTSSFAKLATFATYSRSIALLSGLLLSLVVGVLPVLAVTDAPPSINFSFGNTPTDPPPSLNAVPKTTTEAPPSITVPTLTTTPTTTTTTTTTTTPKPTTTTPAPVVTTPTPAVTDYYLNNKSLEQPEHPVAPQKAMPKTGPEMLYMIIPAFMGSTGYRLYRKKKNLGNK